MPDGVAPGSSLCDSQDPEEWKGKIFSRGRDLVAGDSARARVSLAVSIETVSEPRSSRTVMSSRRSSYHPFPPCPINPRRV